VSESAETEISEGSTVTVVARPGQERRSTFAVDHGWCRKLVAPSTRSSPFRSTNHPESGREAKNVTGVQVALVESAPREGAATKLVESTGTAEVIQKVPSPPERTRVSIVGPAGPAKNWRPGKSAERATVSWQAGQIAPSEKEAIRIFRAVRTGSAMAGVEARRCHELSTNRSRPPAKVKLTRTSVLSAAVLPTTRA
jgi:hypothetical protein